MQLIYKSILCVSLTCIMPSIHAAAVKNPILQLSIISSFLKNPSTTIPLITKIMDGIEDSGCGYADYANRTGIVWSDTRVSTLYPATILEEYKTSKATYVGRVLKDRHTESIRDYPALESVVTEEILPAMFETIRPWRSLPPEVFASIFFQRCSSTSEEMYWHQDLGEHYDPQADYSLILMLSKQDDPEYGWHGGYFKIRPGLPESSYHSTDVTTIIPQYNQAIIFNNKENTHAVTEVIPIGARAKRDIVVIPIHLTRPPMKKPINE